MLSGENLIGFLIRKRNERKDRKRAKLTHHVTTAAKDHVEAQTSFIRIKVSELENLLKEVQKNHSVRPGPVQESGLRFSLSRKVGSESQNCQSPSDECIDPDWDPVLVPNRRLSKPNESMGMRLYPQNFGMSISNPGFNFLGTSNMFSTMKFSVLNSLVLFFLTLISFPAFSEAYSHTFLSTLETKFVMTRIVLQSITVYYH